MSGVPKHERLHHLMSVRDFHLPSLAECQLLQTIDLMIRQSYRYRDPRHAATWADVAGENRRRNILVQPAMAAAVEGLSGVGKTQACSRSLLSYPRQVIVHKDFPRLKGGLHQVVWMSVEVPPSGKASDLARVLMESWDRATGGDRFADRLAKPKINDGMAALEEWRQVACSHFLGLIHLDEIQNLFKLSSLRQRRDRKGLSSVPELSIVEDQLLKWLMQLTNSSQFPTLISGTPDGVDALSRRLAILERITTAGHHAFHPFDDPAASEFSTFLEELGKYQYVKTPLAVDNNLARLVVDLTGGIHRLIIALWISAHRVAFERADDDLRLSDFTEAARTWLAPVAPAVDALRSRDAHKMSRYEDLARHDTTIWARFWSGARSP